MTMPLPRKAEIKIEMRKASFGGDRSEAGRYAANVRWQNKKGEELKGSEGANPSALVLPTLPSGAQVDANRVGAEKLQDIKDVSTDEADFARRLGILVDNAAKFGRNLTTKHTKNESSKGQKINPAKLHEDDRMALAEITDPVERAKYIDGLLKEPMYQDRIVARPPKKKTNWMEEAGMISRAD